MMQHTRYAPTGIFSGGFLLLALFHASACWAGNNEMVEKNVVELDAVNKEALGQIKDIPAQGKVKLKAHVSGTTTSPTFSAGSVPPATPANKTWVIGK